MEQLQHNIVQLTGAVNAQIEATKVIEARLLSLERAYSNVQNEPIQNLGIPTTEADLNEIKRLPDNVRDLQVFEGNPVQYVSWVHNVESILKDYQIVRDKPIYRAVLKHIRQKIRGPADSALISYNIFDEDWPKVKKCLSLHYADKRDIQSLENQLVTMRQNRDTIDKYFNKINHQLSLIINKIKTDDYSQSGMEILVENYRPRALDVLIRGLNLKLSQRIKVQKPQTLPEAYAACMELQNMDLRKNIAQDYQNNNNNFRDHYTSFPTQNYDRYYHRTPKANQNYQLANNYNNTQSNFNPIRPPKPNNPPPRPMQPKPPVPMEVDPSINSRRVNYMNRPSPVVRPSNETSNIPHKSQRLFNLETSDERKERVDEEERQYLDRICDEVNFYDRGLSGTPYLNYQTPGGSILKFLVDTGANKNFVATKIAFNPREIEKPFYIHSAGGDIHITHKISGQFFEQFGNSTVIDFFVLPGLKTFDGIIGDDTLRQ